MTEKELQQAIVDMARLHGWRAFHAFDSRRSEPGFPDLDPSMVAALGLDPALGLWPVSVYPVSGSTGLPDTALEVPA